MKPIIFNTEMVRAIRNGKKTQTRRVMKPQPEDRWKFMGGLSFCKSDHKKPLGCVEEELKCPYGKKGGRLWVRETFAVDAPLKQVRMENEDAMGPSVPHGPYFRADRVHENTGLTWRPSIHMPRWASRITLEITNVRVERVQDISVEDALKEGIRHSTMACPKMEFAQLWNSINEKRGYGWDANPWVFVLCFEKV